jgi:prepilin-type N-terminal cleavage/methylation domain-containing protein
MTTHAPQARRAFTLLEVVVALSIFAVGILAVVGLFAPVARSVSGSSDAEVAARTAEALRLKLQTMQFADVVALLKNSNGAKHALTDADAKPDYNPATDPQILFASRDGSKIGVYTDPIWNVSGRNSDREKYFEIALVRNEAVSPLGTATDNAPAPNLDATAPMLGYVARLRWPSFVPDGTATGAIQVGANPAATVKFDHSNKQVLFFPGSIVR